MIKPRDIADRVRRNLPAFDLPKLGKEIDIPIYMVHNSLDPDDYFFIFDFEQFVEQTRSGIFVRPRLLVWAGRSDFGRSHFARQFRESFGREFDVARAQLAAEDSKPRGWFGFLFGTFAELRGETLSAFVANLVLLIATSAGTKVLAQILPAGWLAGKSDATKLEENIEATKAKVDTALQNLEIKLHEELYQYAYRDGTRGKRADIEYDAWPLPSFVRQSFETKKPGAWW